MTNLLILRPLKDNSVQAIKRCAPNFNILTSTDGLSLDELKNVEITVGWENNVGEQLLQLKEEGQGILNWIQTYSAGVDDLDLKRLKENNIILTNASGVHASQISESVIAMLLSHYRGILTAHKAQENKTWERIRLNDLALKKMLIVGTGNIGRQLAKVASAMAVDVYGVNRSGRQLPEFNKIYPQKEIDDVLPTMDIVISILPLTDETYHLFNSQRFEKFKKGAVFVNVGRGESVDTSALITACQSDRIDFAALDVFEEEPLPNSSPLWTLDNVLITPHISGISINYQEKFMKILLENLNAYKEQLPLPKNVVDYTLGY
ncbi:NAD(P)-dependent oxidoreductase [Vagococcus elongatus]|uniref:Hydroxyacid dehydrogenase n=1 Tax=Vagococcus elongatus TaxID=180344 RepID=A0A430B291_9ENTE|nr:NAD(P)-dependent oxidoreductase [Vagococcus elongatus]RSU14371.1 hypothetical protein CBF29_03475 [Vagococcus elongatus]